jgi:hypothetical protein
MDKQPNTCVQYPGNQPGDADKIQICSDFALTKGGFDVAIQWEPSIAGKYLLEWGAIPHKGEGVVFVQYYTNDVPSMGAGPTLPNSVQYNLQAWELFYFAVRSSKPAVFETTLLVRVYRSVE